MTEKAIVREVGSIEMGPTFRDLASLVRFLESPEGPALVKRMEELEGQINAGRDAQTHLLEAERLHKEAQAREVDSHDMLRGAEAQAAALLSEAQANAKDHLERAQQAANKVREEAAVKQATAGTMMQEAEAFRRDAVERLGVVEAAENSLRKRQADVDTLKSDLERRLAIIKEAQA